MPRRVFYAESIPECKSSSKQGQSCKVVFENSKFCPARFTKNRRGSDAGSRDPLAASPHPRTKQLPAAGCRLPVECHGHHAENMVYATKQTTEPDRQSC